MRISDWSSDVCSSDLESNWKKGLLVEPETYHIRLSDRIRLESVWAARSFVNGRMALHHVFLDNRIVVQNARPTHAGQIQGLKFSEDHQFGQGAPHGGRLLHAVTAAAMGEKHVLDIGVRTDEDIVIDGVHIVVAGPAMGAPDRLDSGYARGQERPKHLVQQFVLHRSKESQAGKESDRTW